MRVMFLFSMKKLVNCNIIFNIMQIMQSICRKRKTFETRRVFNNREFYYIWRRESDS